MMKTLEYRAPDISCQGCVASLRNVLTTVPGVMEVDADPATKTVRVQFDESAIDPSAVLNASADAGFPALD